MQHQSKLASLAEAVVNTAIGLFIAMFATALICKAYGIPMSWTNNFIITFWMTVLSVLRSYILRRLFNSEFWKTWRASLQAWWIVRRPGVVQFIDRMADAYGRYGRGRRF